MRIAAAIVFAGLSLFAAEQKPAKLPPEVQQVVDLALAAPPEFAADALLRLVAAGRIADRAVKHELIATAFTLAGRAQHPMPLVLVASHAADTNAAYIASAMRLKLDALSLQTRALQAMLTIDKTAAAEMFSGMTPPAVTPATCEAALVPNVAAYWELLTRFAQDVFTGGDGEKNSRIDFVRVALDRIASHVEVAPAALMLASTPTSASQFEILAGALTIKMQSLAPDDRSFSFAAHDSDEALTSLVAVARQKNAHRDQIEDAYRSYFAANLSATRCVDSTPSVTLSDVHAKKFEGQAKFDRYWQSDASKQIFEACMKLRIGSDGAPMSETARSTREWKRQLGDFLNQLAGWTPSAENSEADYYHQRAIVYEALLELTPAGDLHNRVLDEYMTFLRSSNVQQQNPVEWYWHARSTLNRIRTGSPAEAQRLLAAFAASGNVILSLEALLESTAPDYSMFPN